MGGKDISSVCNHADRRYVIVFRSALHIACFQVVEILKHRRRRGLRGAEKEKVEVVMW